MAITAAQKTEIEAVVQAILDASTQRRKRHFSDVFLDLVDRESWPEYYDVSRHISLRRVVFQMAGQRG